MRLRIASIWVLSTWRSFSNFLRVVCVECVRVCVHVRIFRHTHTTTHTQTHVMHHLNTADTSWSA